MHSLHSFQHRQTAQIQSGAQETSNTDTDGMRRPVSEGCVTLPKITRSRRNGKETGL